MKYKNREWLINEYWTKAKSLGDVAQACGVNHCTILYWMNKFGIKRRSVSDASWTNSFLDKKRPGIDTKYMNPGWLKKQYVDLQKSTKEISTETGVPQRTVYTWIVKAGISPRSSIAARRTERFHLMSKGSKTGEKSPMWKGGRKTACGGYILLAQKEHPYADSCGYIMEHRLVMEKLIGRYLRPEEAVHHIDGNVKNNNPSNLMLFDSWGAHRKHHANIERNKLTNGVVRVTVAPAL